MAGIVERQKAAVERQLFAIRCVALRTGASAGASTEALLPRADPGWRAAARAKHDELFRAFARTHGMTLEEYKRAAGHWLAAQTRHAEVRLRMRSLRFEGFLSSGRYKTQFELPMSMSGGAGHRAARMMLEHTVLGVPTSVRPADRPIYAYLSGSYEAGQVQQYGEVVLRLKRETRRRATFMLGDSLDHAVIHFTEPSFVPCPVTRPSVDALLPVDVLQASTIGDASPPPYGYAEAQLYGGLRPDDIESVVYTLNTQPIPSARHLLNRLGVQWTVIPGAGP